MKYIFDNQNISQQIFKINAVRDSDYQTWVYGINQYLSVVLTDNYQRTIAIVATDPRRITEEKVNPVVGILTPNATVTDLNDETALRLQKK